MGLTNAFPSLADDDAELVSIPGSPPDLVSPPDGCRFADRCPFATPDCARDPPMTAVDDRHRARCHYTDRADEFRERSRRAETWARESTDAARDRPRPDGGGGGDGTGDRGGDGDESGTGADPGRTTRRGTGTGTETDAETGSRDRSRPGGGDR
jgi:oligopeptide/dipeptide ABC transporter ATP-binding protein